VGPASGATAAHRRRLCQDGLRRYVAEAEAALAEADDWAAFTGFLARVVDADVHSLTVHLPGAFTPTDEMGRDAVRASELTTTLAERAHQWATPPRRGRTGSRAVAGGVRGGARTRSGADRQLRRRQLAVLLAGLPTAPDPAPLPGPAPAAGEFDWRWRQRR
jgi:hypothetical protein